MSWLLGWRLGRPLAWVTALTSVSAGSALGARVAQDPSSAICKSGAAVEIRCRAVDLQAQTVVWYLQLPKRGLTPMATSNVGSSATHERDFPEAKFPVSHPNLTFSSLTVTGASPADSSLYLFAASGHSAGHRPETRTRTAPGPPRPGPGPRRATWERKTTD